MSTVHHLWPHRHHDPRVAGDLRPGTVLAGLAALVALIVLVGGLAGVVTWAVLQLFTVAVG